MPNKAAVDTIASANMVQNVLTNISFVLELLLGGGVVGLCM